MWRRAWSRMGSSSIFGDLGVGQPRLGGERLAGEPGLAGEGPAQCDGEAPPQLGGAGVEQHRAGVVVAVRAHRFAELVVISGVLLRAGHADAMRTGPGVSAWMTGQCLAVAFPASVDGAEGGCGQGGEGARVVGDGGGDAFAAGQSGADELVDLGAGWAPGGAAGLACDGQDAAGFADGGVAVEQFAGGSVDVIDAATSRTGCRHRPGCRTVPAGVGLVGKGGATQSTCNIQSISAQFRAVSRDARSRSSLAGGSCIVSRSETSSRTSSWLRTCSGVISSASRSAVTASVTWRR